MGAPTFDLGSRPAIVAVCKAPSTEPCLVVGPTFLEPLGHAVAIGAGCALPGLEPLAFIAHLTPDEADGLAQKLKESAEEVRNAIAGLPPIPGITPSTNEGPPISFGTDAGPDHILIGSGEFAGVPCQVQHPRGQGEPSDSAGMLGASALVGPDGIPRVMILTNHSDGVSLAAILDEDELGGFEGALGEAKAAMQGMGRPH